MFIDLMIASALLGVTISVACLLPPIVHFITGPLGPFIGGYFAGSRIQADPVKALSIGAMMGILSVLPILGLVTLLKRWIEIEVGLVYPISFGMSFYITLLGGGGAMLGGAIANKPKS